MKKKFAYTTVCTSGFFDNLHLGHVESFRLAHQYGYRLIVFVDSDRKAILKKGFVVMPEHERAALIRSIKYVDEAVIIDTSIAEALEKYVPDVFYKGGDRTIDNLPLEEIEVCKRNNINIICEGSKIQASSLLLDKTSIIKPWGKYNVLSQGLGYVVKKLTINPHCQISLQYNKFRSEYWTVQKGEVDILLNYEKLKLSKGDSLFVDKEVVHRISNNCDDILEIIEVQTGNCDELDIVRLEDDFGRI